MDKLLLLRSGNNYTVFKMEKDGWEEYTTICKESIKRYLKTEKNTVNIELYDKNNGESRPKARNGHKVFQILINQGDKELEEVTVRVHKCGYEWENQKFLQYTNGKLTFKIGSETLGDDAVHFEDLLDNLWGGWRPEENETLTWWLKVS